MIEIIDEAVNIFIIVFNITLVLCFAGIWYYTKRHPELYPKDPIKHLQEQVKRINKE